MKEINCKGLNCPTPVINTKKYFDSIERGSAKVIVDNEVAKNNILKFATSNNYGAEVKEEGGQFNIFIIKGEGKVEIYETKEIKKEKFTIVISKDKLGEGDDKLGEILMKSYFFALSEADEIPTDMIFYNGGVKLTVEDSSVLESLNKLQERNVNMQVCGTCLDFYELKEKLVVGEISNMYSIVETMNSSDKVINI